MTLKIDDLIAEGASAQDVEALPTIQFTPALAPEAYHGLAGRIVKTIEPYSEADPVAILMHLLVGFGNLVGRGPHALVEMTEHGCSEFVALVGDSSKGRKGQAWSTPRYLLRQVDEEWAKNRIVHGLSTGEGLIYNVRDQPEEQQRAKEADRVAKHQTVIADEGVRDKRLLAFEPEMASVLKRMQGQTNTLSAVIREAFDSGDLATLTKNSPLRATGAHVSIIAHATRAELVRCLTETERANGFANRFICVLVRRSKCLPEPVPVHPSTLAPLVAELRGVADYWAQRGPYRLIRDEDARELWAGVYPKLSEGKPGLLGAILARAEAHVLRLSVLYAVLDCSPFICPAHLRAALAVWDYAETSAKRIFGDHLLGLSVADTILAALHQRGPLTRTQISALFGRNKPADEITAALVWLEEAGKAKRTVRLPLSGSGRPVEQWEAA